MEPADEAATHPSGGPESIAAAYQRLRRAPLKDLSREQIALRAGLEMCLAVGKADGKRAVERLDAVGYQPLALEGELPENPDRPLPAAAVRSQIETRSPVPIGDLPADTLEVMGRAQVREIFPAVAEWMLPEDSAVIIRPAEVPGGDWVRGPCCLVIRVRAGRPAMVGGNLLASLK